MLKWFRLYNKWLLVVFGSLLMVVFLVEGALYGIMPKQGDQVIGHVNGRSVTFNDQAQANFELETLGRTMPALTLLAPHDPQQWLMLIEGAKEANLSASNTEVAQLIALATGSQTDIEALAQRAGITPDQLAETLRHWLMVQQYVELMSGLAHLSVTDRIQALQQGIQYLNMGLGNPQLVIDPARGLPRISRPLLERFIEDQQATVTVQAVAIGPEHGIMDVPEPDTKTIEALYNEYKDQLPGSEHGYGLGYKLPDRVQLEYLTIPIGSVREKVHVQESQMVAYYDQHPDKFSTTPATSQPGKTGTVQPYLEVRSQIQSQLIDDAARKLTDSIAQAAYTSLIENARPLDEKEGYRVINDSWKPLRLEDLAKDLQNRFGVVLEVRRVDKSWLTLADIQQLPVLGQSSLALGQNNLPTTTYIASTRELKPDKNNPAINLHLQRLLPSHQVQSSDGSICIFRILDAQPSHTPALSDIRKEVALDAQRVASYQANRAKVSQWQKMLDQPLANSAATLKTSVIGPASFNRRNTFGGVMEVPQIPGIGQSAEFVDKVFDLIAHTPSIQKEVATTQPTDKQDEKAKTPLVTSVIPVDDKLTVYLVKVTDYEPMTQKDFDQQMSLSFNKIWVNMAMTHGLKSDPFSVENLAKRIGFQWEPGYKKQATE